MTQETRDLIFVSYSHRDKTWMEKLLIFLKPYQRKGQLMVWADPYIEVGDVWKREIDHALPRAKVGLLLISPYFLASDFIMEHEVPPLEAAAENGHTRIFCVPLSSSTVEPTGLDKYQWARPPHAALDLLSEPEQHAALVTITKTLVEVFQKTWSGLSEVVETPISFSSLSEEVQRIVITPSPAGIRVATQPVHVIQGEYAPLGKLYGVPPQRPHFQERPDELVRLKTLLLIELHSAVGLTGKTAKIGVHGQGGIGKTVLAIALANDENVRRTFPDGIYWFTLAQEPDPIAFQIDWLKALGEQAPMVTTIGDGKTQLQTHLAEKNCLLILDDVWEADHAAALDVLGPKSRLLLTTRDATILTAVGAKEETLGVLDQNAALCLLAEWSGKAITDLPPLASQVVDICGGIPLALALAGAQIQEGMRYETLVQALEIGDLEFLDHPYGSIFKSMKLSVQALPEFERARYLELVIFPEDAHVPEQVIERLWKQTADLTTIQTHKLLIGFARKSLLLRKEEHQLPGISFHDLQHDFLRLTMPDASSVHNQLLEAYRQNLHQPTQDFSWSRIPDDEPYLWTYLAYHLIQSNQRDELTKTVKDLRYLGKKMWLLGANAVEKDIQRTVSGVGHDKGLSRLQRLIPQSAHLLSGQPFLKGVLPTLLSRTQNEPDLHQEVNGLEHTFDFPYLKPVWPMPDVPDPALVRTLEHHTSGVKSCAIDPTGRWVVSAADDQTLKVWDLTTGDLVRTLKDHMGQVNCCAIDPTGRWIISGGNDQTVKVWNLMTGDLVRTLKDHMGEVYCCAIDPSGRWVVSGAGDRTLKIWDLTTGDLVRTLTAHTAWVFTCTIDPSGRWVVSGAGDRTLKIWDLTTGDLVRTLKSHMGQVNCCAIDPTGRWIVSGGNDRTLRVWDLTTGNLMRTLAGHAGWVYCCAIDPMGQWIASGADDEVVNVWELTTGNLVRKLVSHTGWVYCCAIDPSGRWVISGANDRTLKVWDLTTTDLVRTLTSHTGVVYSCAIDPSGRWVASGAGDQTLKVWDLTTGDLMRTLTGHTSVGIDPMGRLVVSETNTETLKLWDPTTGDLVSTLASQTGMAYFHAIDPSGQWVVSGVYAGTLKIWDLRTGNLVRTLKGHTGRVNCCAIDSTGQWVVSGANDETLKIWDLRTGNLVRTLKGHTGQIYCCAIDPTGRWVISGAADRTLKIWDLTTGELVRTLMGHTGMIYSCAIDPSGQWVVSGANDGGIRVWTLQTGKLFALLRVDGPIFGLAWVPQSLRFAAAGARGIYLFKLIPHSKNT